MAEIKITLEAARVNAGLSLRSAAEKMGISTQTLINWEKGRTAPSVPQGRALSDLYQMPMSFIFFPNATN